MFKAIIFASYDLVTHLKNMQVKKRKVRKKEGEEVKGYKFPPLGVRIKTP